MFLNGLNDDFQFQLLNTDYAEFQHVVDKAIVIENKIKEMEKDSKRKVSFHGQPSGSNVRPCFSQPNQFFKSPQMNRPQMPVQVPCPQNLQQGPHSNAPTSQGALTQGSHTGGAYFMCGLTSHFAWQCLTRSTAPGAGNQVKPQGQQNFMYGRVNHMTNDQAQQAQDVVLGMFLASSHPATILFDSGASHSFISSSFVAKHSLPIATMKHTILVNSPGGKTRTKHICLAVSITIRG
jgi:hypothetical protein